jgi:hypothetical protein
MGRSGLVYVKDLVHAWDAHSGLPRISYSGTVFV